MPKIPSGQPGCPDSRVLYLIRTPATRQKFGESPVGEQFKYNNPRVSRTNLLRLSLQSRGHQKTLLSLSSMSFTGRWRELVKKYGKVAVGVHFSVSAASITGLYIAIKSNVDVASVLEKVGLPGVSKKEEEASIEAVIRTDPMDRTAIILEDESIDLDRSTKKNRSTDLAASSGGALALAVLCNKALFPVRVPITIALTPPVARFLARRNIIKNVWMFLGFFF